MALQNFVDFLPPSVKAAWLNAVDVLKFTVFDDAATKAAARTALQLNPQLVAEGTDSGVVNAAVVTLRGPVTGYVRAIGSKVNFTATATNTGAATLDVNGTGAAAIVDQAGNACTGGELFLPVVVAWTGAVWKIIDGGILLTNKRTSYETAALVVPVNYLLAPGNVLRYGTNTNPGTTPMSAAIQAALDQRAEGGAPIYVPTGIYLQEATVTYPLSDTPMEISGEGISASILTTALNIENLTNAGADAANGLYVPIIRDMAFKNTYPVVAGAGATVFHIRLKNSLRALIQNVHCQGNFGDTDHNDANHGGIWFEQIGGYTAAFMNTVDACWIQNAQINIETSDSIVQNSFVWGHPCQYAIRAGHGNTQVLNCPGIIGSRSKGGVYLPSNSLQCKIANNFFDGSNDIVNSGWGVYSENAATFAMINGNNFWRQYYGGVYAEDVQAMMITGNQFWDCGRADSASDPLNSDIVIEGTTFQPNSLTIVGNTAYRGATRANLGLFILEVNSGFTCVNNRYIGNTVSQSGSKYKNPAIVRTATLFNSPNGSITIGNVGQGTDTELYSTFTASLTGCTTVPTGTVRYSRQGNLVSLFIPGITGVSNTNAATLTGVPAAITPANAVFGFALITDNGVVEDASVIIETTSIITLRRPNGVAFTAAGNKGTFTGVTLVYQLQ
jgi:hypothetical protein